MFTKIVNALPLIVAAFLVVVLTQQHMTLPMFVSAIVAGLIFGAIAKIILRFLFL